MKPNVFETLRQIRDKHGAGEFGKIAQKLLAIALCRLCFTVEERAIQGVDIDAIREDLRYSFEVKTTDKDEITIGEKDIRGLKQRTQDGYKIGFAVLRVSLLSNWVLASGDNILPGTVRIGRFKTQRILPLEEKVNETFSVVVDDYGRDILSAAKGQGQMVADKILSRERSTKAARASSAQCQEQLLPHEPEK